MSENLNRLFGRFLPSIEFREAISAADLAHRAACPYEAGLVDPVLQLLVRDGVPDQALELRVGGAGAERRLQIPLAAREQARAQLAVRGQADAIAGGAERLRDRVDEADLAGAVGEAVALRGRGRLRGDLLERPALLDDRPDLGARQHLVVAPRALGVERHELDEADDVRLAAGELGERGHLRLREALDRDRVDLDRAQLGVALRLLEPAQD